MSEFKDRAKAYAADGWPVLQLYGINQNDEGELGCACGKAPGALACNPGKHPIFGTHGVTDATDDLEVIDTWPETGINIGIAGRDTYPIVDIDHEPTAIKIEAELRRRGIPGAARTGGGTLHIYLQSAPTTNGVITRDDGVALGEIRAAGYYVVAPPSHHISGRDYEWLIKDILETGPYVITDDAWTWAKELFGAVGTKIKPRKEASGDVRAPSGAIEPVAEIPFATSNSTLMSMMLPSYPVGGDRSDELFKLACEIVRELDFIGAVVDTDIQRETIAGMIKHADTVRIHPKGPKFANRYNADRYYWEMTTAAIVSVATSPAGTITRSVDYGYSIEDGFYLEKPGPKNTTIRERICNFEPRWIERLVSWTGDVQRGVQREDRVIQVAQGDEIYTFRLEPEQYKDDRMLAANVRMMTPPHFIIETRMGGTFMDGIGHYSGRVPVRRVFAATGWLPEQDMFLLPGIRGAITATGIDDSVFFESDSSAEMLVERIYDEDADLELALRIMFGTVPARTLVPLLAQIMAAPLCSLGFEERTIMHLLGETGSYKSSLIAALLSIYGYVKGDAQGRVSWQSGTENAIRALQHNYRDLPVLIDDFKTGLVDARKANAIIQGYGDSTGRQRLNRNLKASESHAPRGLTLSSGEQWWEGQRSTNYRTLLVRMKKGSMTLSQIIALHDVAKDGSLAIVGIRWLQWLAQMGREAARERLLFETDKARPKIVDLVGEEHARHVSAISSLFAVNAMMLEFVGQEAPAFRDEYRKLSSEGWVHLLGSAKDQAEEGQEASPLSQLLTAMRQSIDVGTTYLAPRTMGGDAYGTPMGRVIGFFKDGEMWLTSWLTLGWYESELRSQGRNPTVDWSSIVQDGRENFGGTNNVEYFYDPEKQAQGRRSRMLRLPISVLSEDPRDVVVEYEGVTEEVPDGF